MWVMSQYANSADMGAQESSKMLSRRGFLRLGGATVAIAGTGTTVLGAEMIAYPDKIGDGAARQIEASRLAEIIAEHERWLEDPADGQRAMLAGADLAGLMLESCSLCSADLSGAKLTGAHFRNVDLERACLIGANLANARLDQCPIGSTDFTGAMMAGCVIDAEHRNSYGETLVADANEACFRHADLRGAKLKLSIDRGDFRNANMRGINFDGSMLSVVDQGMLWFDHADLTDAQFGHSVVGANLSKANLTGADFSNITDVSCS